MQLDCAKYCKCCGHMQAQSDDDEAGETVALNMAASGDKFMEEFFEQV